MNNENIVTEMFLTTVDNPYDPAKQFPEWRVFDWEKGYYTNSYVDRVVQELENNGFDKKIKGDPYDYAIKEIVKQNPLLYKIVYCEIKEKFLPLTKIYSE